MSKNPNTYYRLAQKSLRVTFAFIFCLGFIPTGAGAKVTCDGMRCNHGNPMVLHHSQMGSSNNFAHGCCSGTPDDPCDFEAGKTPDTPNRAVASSRVENNPTIYHGFIEIDRSSQDKIISSFGQGHQIWDKTGLTPIYLQTLSLRC